VQQIELARLLFFSSVFNWTFLQTDKEQQNKEMEFNLT
jgi:hypothetical protein